MKNKIVIFLLLSAMHLSAQGGMNYSLIGSANQHTQYAGGIGAEKKFLMPLGNHDVFSQTFRKKGLLQYNSTGDYVEFNDGLSWKRVADSAYVKANYKPIGYVPPWTDITGKPEFFSGAYDDLSGKPNLSLYYLSSNPNNYISNLGSFTTTNLAEGANLYWTIGRFNTAFAGKSTTDLPEGTKLFYTTPRFNTDFAAKTTDALTEGAANKYDKTVSQTGSNGIVIGGAYPNFTISKKRQETYSGTTIAAGTYTVAFGTAYSVAPNIQANIINGTDSQNIRTTSITTTGFTVLVRNRVDVVGLLPTWGNVSGATVDILVTEK